MVAAAIRTIFAQPTGPLVREQVEVVAAMLEPKLPAVAAMLREAREEITAFAVPRSHWPKIWSTNPLERLNREVKRRTNVVGMVPNPAALHRLTACVLIEAHDEWQVGNRRYLSEGFMAMLNPPAPTQISATSDTPKEDLDTPAAVTA
jgi:putative transposase